MDRLREGAEKSTGIETDGAAAAASFARRSSRSTFGFGCTEVVEVGFPTLGNMAYCCPLGDCCFIEPGAGVTVKGPALGTFVYPCVCDKVGPELLISTRGAFIKIDT